METKAKKNTYNDMDELTGICNRLGFYEHTEELLKKYPDIQFNIIYMNIRKFKVVNDLFGWDAGDKVLINFANSLREEFGNEIASYGRMERDNFVCCVSDEVLEKNNWMRIGNICYEVEGMEYKFSSCY